MFTNHKLHGSSSGKDGTGVLQVRRGVGPQPSLLAPRKAQRCSGSESFPLASPALGSPFTQRQLLSRTFSPALPKDSVSTSLPPSCLRRTHHLLLATSCPIRSSIQLRATKAFHQAPQCLANILESKCEITTFYIFKTCTKASLW